MSSADVVIVGAGAAGLAAAETLHAAGVGFRVLEAKNRLGGRAYTNTHSFGVPWDEGCHWLHSASINPFRDIADDLGFNYLEQADRDPFGMHLGDRWASDEEVTNAWSFISKAIESAHETGLAGKDIPASETMDYAGWRGRLARHWMTLLSAVPPEQISTLDYSLYVDTEENYPVENGYGALVAAQAKGLDVTLNAPVKTVKIETGRVVVEGDFGSLESKALIIAVPTTVLASGAITFEPGLPNDIEQAFHDLPLGHAEKAVIMFDRDVFGSPPTSYIDTIDLRDPSRPPINFTLNPFGRTMAIGMLAGENARELSGDSKEMAAFAIDALVDAFGSGLRNRITGTAGTNWTGDPFIAGAYSCAMPGRAGARMVLQAPFAERVFFCGEAVSLDAYSTVHGARQTGIRQAEAALTAL